MIHYQEVCLEAIKIIKEVGHFIKDERINFSNEVVEFKGSNDLVSYVDKTAEEKIINGLSPLINDCGFLAEENTVENENKPYTWIIDPLDGAKS